jgi:hypothetical protein
MNNQVLGLDPGAKHDRIFCQFEGDQTPTTSITSRPTPVPSCWERKSLLSKTTPIMKSFALIITLLSYMAALSCAFVSPGQRFHGVVQRPPTAPRVLDTTASVAAYQPASLQRQRKSVASVQTMVFGLGAPEIAIILVAAAFLLGPQKLAELGRDAGKVRGEHCSSPSLVIAAATNTFYHFWAIDCW